MGADCAKSEPRIKAKWSPAIPISLGLLVSSVLFGVSHVLNTCDYFEGRFEFAWWFGLVALASGLFYGILREKTGGILAGAIPHNLADALTQTGG
jgi:membrane protease YdiL (CAAX protease family)